MLVWVIATLLLAIALTLVALSSKKEQHWGSFMRHRPFIVLNIVTLVVAVIALIFLAYLLSYHAWLISNNKTTFKHIRDKAKRSHKSSIIKKVSEPHSSQDESINRSGFSDDDKNLRPQKNTFSWAQVFGLKPQTPSSAAKI